MVPVDPPCTRQHSLYTQVIRVSPALALGRVFLLFTAGCPMLDLPLEFGRRKVPVILQSEAAECGLACLAMVASYRGFRTDLTALRQRFTLSLKGLTMHDIARSAEQLQLLARPFKLEVDELRKLQTPCILHWQMDHFVVLVKADAKGILIHDPAVGVCRLPYSGVGPLFSGIALELVPGPDFAEVDLRRRIRLGTLIGTVRGLGPMLARIFVLAFALEIVGVLMPLLNQWITDEALTSGDQAIKLSGRELDRRMRWQNLSVESVNRAIRTQKLNLIFGNMNLVVSGIAGVVLFRIGAGMVMDGKGAFTIGMLVAFASYSAQFGARMRALIDNLIEFRMLSLHCERLADIVLESPEPEGPDYAGIADLPPRIELIDVSFRYSDNSPWVLRQVNLTIEPGESLALVGGSGGGKTTLIKIILGGLTPSEGEVRYGGVPIRQLGTRAYRSVLGDAGRPVAGRLTARQHQLFR